jgi:myo-inositol 2-dehydrogenase/D-chiro-inositol 1-dehydrogenase
VKEFRVGLLGAGWISGVHARALARLTRDRVVGVWSRTRPRAEAFAREHGVALATDDVEELVAAVDVVCVNSPNARHLEHARSAARAGRHVIVEKPLAVSLAEGEALVAACREAGVGLAYAEELAFVPRFVRAREILRSGALGDPLYVTQREAHAGPYSEWFFTREEAGGGVLMDMACHSVECVRWLLGKPAVRSVTARLASTLHRDRTRLEDHAVVHLGLDGGVSASCEASWALQGGMQSRLEIWGTRGYLDVDLLHGTGLRLFVGGEPRAGLGAGWQTPAADWLEENGYPQELGHFLDCFRDGRVPEESGEDGLAVLEVLQAAYASAREERTVALPFRPQGVRYAVDLWLKA